MTGRGRRLSSSNSYYTLHQRRFVANRGVDADLRMSLHVFVAHTGAQVDADPAAFESLDAFQQWVAKATQIPASDQILLTEKGRHVKLPTLLIEASSKSALACSLITNWTPRRRYSSLTKHSLPRPPLSKHRSPHSLIYSSRINLQIHLRMRRT